MTDALGGFEMNEALSVALAVALIAGGTTASADPQFPETPVGTEHAPRTGS